MRKLVLLIMMIAGVAVGRAVGFTWDVDFQSVFDNREGDHDITATKTYFFTNLATEVGVRFSPADRIAGGVVWFQPIGCQWEGHHVSPTLYYRHEGERWRFSMGMFPRTQLVEEMPGYLWSDSLSYSQRNIRGVLVQYVAPRRGYLDLYVDWRGMQTERQREAFNIVFHGEMSPRGNWFGFGGYAQMNHFALQKNPPADQHIVDNFTVNPYLRADLGRKIGTDSLTLRAGYLATIERNRADADGRWHTPGGFYLEAVGEYRRFGAKNTLYIGKPLLPSFNTPNPHFLDDSAPHGTPQEIAVNPVVWGIMGPELYNAEPFYQRCWYDRFDIYAYILRNRNVSLMADLDFNISPGSFIFYQRLLLRVTLH